MKLTYRDQRVAVYDELLNAEEQLEVLRYVNAADFRKVLPLGWNSAFRLDDGDPLVGIQVYSRKPVTSCRSPTYPTETALDILVETLFSLRAQIGETIGYNTEDQPCFSLCPYVYPAGSGMGWHTDRNYQGAYVYYPHRKWCCHWGGELLVAATGASDESGSIDGRRLLGSSSIEEDLAQGAGRYFAPLPNRLILLRGDTYHMIKRVESAAGDNLRLSISGFFLQLG